MGNPQSRSYSRKQAIPPKAPHKPPCAAFFLPSSRHPLHEKTRQASAAAAPGPHIGAGIGARTFPHSTPGALTCRFSCTPCTGGQPAPLLGCAGPLRVGISLRIPAHPTLFCGAFLRLFRGRRAGLEFPPKTTLQTEPKRPEPLRTLAGAWRWIFTTDTMAFSGFLTPWWDVVACGGFLFRETTTLQPSNGGAFGYMVGCGGLKTVGNRGVKKGLSGV